MFARMTQTLRVKAAVLTVVLYACTLLVPHAAVALFGPQGLVHCFTQQEAAHDHGANSASAHIHADGTAHSHDDAPANGNADEQKGPAAACCGLFTATAMTCNPPVLLPTQIATSRLPSGAFTGFDGQGPSRIIRPPIA
jgi:hypothetical protein